MGMVCLCFCLGLEAQMTTSSVVRTSLDPSTPEDFRAELVKANATRASGIILTLAGISFTAIGIDMELRCSQFSITGNNKSVYALCDPDAQSMKSGKTYILCGTLATAAGATLWYAGAKKLRQIRFSVGPKGHSYLSIAPPLPGGIQGQERIWQMQVSLRF